MAQHLTAPWQNGGELPKIGVYLSKNVYL